MPKTIQHRRTSPPLPAQTTKKRPITSAMSTEEQSPQHHERRFAQIDRDIFSVKTDVGVLQADVKTLASGQLALQESQDRGFSDVKATLIAKSQEQPKVSIAMLVSILGVCTTIIVVGIGAFWAVVLLLAEPIREDLKEHKLATGSHSRDLALLDERVNNLVQKQADAHAQQDATVKTLAGTVLEFHEAEAARELELAHWKGKLDAYEETRRLEEERTYERLQKLPNTSNP